MFAAVNFRPGSHGTICVPWAFGGQDQEENHGTKNRAVATPTKGTVKGGMDSLDRVPWVFGVQDREEPHGTKNRAVATPTKGMSLDHGPKERTSVVLSLRYDRD